MAANKELPKNVSQSTRVTDRYPLRKHRGLTKIRIKYRWQRSGK
jgi:hypothetical protein